MTAMPDDDDDDDANDERGALPVPANSTPGSPGLKHRQRGNVNVNIRLRGKMAKLYLGELTVADMDDEELARLQFKDSNGRFTGNPPSVLPTALVNMMRAELVRRAVSIREQEYTRAMKELVRIALSGEREGDRLKAIKEMMDRTEGKPTEKIEISNGEKPFEMTLMKSVKIRRATITEDGRTTTLEEEVPDDRF